jgi:hypothetical protein
MSHLEVLLVGCWELGENVNCAMWVVVKHFEKFPRLFAGQLICVNVLPPLSPEWCIYSWKGYFLRMEVKLCLLEVYIYKKRNRTFALKIWKCLIKNKIKMDMALFKERFKGPPMKQGHVLTLQLHEAEKRTFWNGLQKNYLVVKVDQ